VTGKFSRDVSGLFDMSRLTRAGSDASSGGIVANALWLLSSQNNNTDIVLCLRQVKIGEALQLHKSGRQLAKLVAIKLGAHQYMRIQTTVATLTSISFKLTK